jgi:two-component system, NtrC family, sensor histidine kinase KinB
MTPAPLSNLNFKAKIRLLLLLLFSIVTGLGILGGYFLDRIANNAVDVTRTNLRTLDYTQQMWLALNETVSVLSAQDFSSSEYRVQLRKSLSRFELYFGLQAGVITGNKEKVLMETLRADFEDFKAAVRSFETKGQIPLAVMMQTLDMQNLLQQVYNINRDSIREKNEWAGRQANRVTLALILSGFFFFIFAVLALFFFPDSIARPIRDLNDGIREIARKNYNQRLPVHTTDEFGQVAMSFNIMAEKLAEYENLNIAKILIEKRRIETLIEQMNYPILGFDRKGVALFANHKALEILGMKEEDILGRSAAAVARENEVFREVAADLLNGQALLARSYPSFSVIRQGKTLYFEKEVLAVSENGESPGDGFVIILKNITEFKEHDLAKTNFMATLSHELKTPISAIDLSLGLMQDERMGGLNADQRELAQTIRDNTRRLLKMVNEILDLSKIETGVMEFSSETVQPAELVARALENTRIFIDEKSLQIETDIAPDLPALTIDAQKTGAALTNFLTNAIRYSPEGGRIRIAVHRLPAEIEFSVEDEGPGIPEEEQERIFQRYSRSRNDRTKGTGLGLAISKEFIERQGGRIWVQSKMGEGSRFGFALPA